MVGIVRADNAWVIGVVAILANDYLIRVVSDPTSIGIAGMDSNGGTTGRRSKYDIGTGGKNWGSNHG
jgi:hypothetical protein